VSDFAVVAGQRFDLDDFLFSIVIDDQWIVTAEIKLGGCVLEGDNVVHSEVETGCVIPATFGDDVGWAVFVAVDRGEVVE